MYFILTILLDRKKLGSRKKYYRREFRISLITRTEKVSLLTKFTVRQVKHILTVGDIPYITLYASV